MLNKCVVLDQFGNWMRIGFRTSDWKGPRGQGMGNEGEGSRSLVRVHGKREVRKENNDEKGERQDIIGQIVVNGTGQGLASNLVLEGSQTEKMITGQGKENVRMLDLVSTQPQQNLGFEWLAHRKSMVQDIPKSEKSGDVEKKKSGSEAATHPILLEYTIRPPL